MTDSETSAHRTYTVFMGIMVTVFLVVFGLLSNSLSLQFFVHKMRNRVFSRIFSAIALTDLLTAFLTAFVALCYLTNRNPVLFKYYFFRELWGSLWNFTSRYSVYLVALLSISRTLCIISPLSAVKGNVVCGFVAVYAVYLVLTTPAFYSINHYYLTNWCALALNKSQFLHVHDGKYFMIVLSVPALLILPLPLTIISAALSLFIIGRYARRVKANSFNRMQFPELSFMKIRHSAMTVILFVVVYIGLNVPYSVIYVYVQTVSYLKSIPPNLVITGGQDAVIFVFSNTHVLSISLNAAINPVLYYCRIREFKRYVDLVFFSKVRNLLQTLQRTDTTPPITAAMNIAAV